MLSTISFYVLGSGRYPKKIEFYALLSRVTEALEGFGVEQKFWEHFEF